MEFLYSTLILVYENLWSIVFAGLAFMLYRWWSYPSANFPPGVRGYPVVGALPYLGRYPERAIAKWSRKKYGPIMSVRFGTKDIVVINDYDQLHAAFITKGWSFKDRPPVPLFDTLSGGRLGFTFRDADTEWKIQRNFALSKLKEHGLIQLKVEERVKKAVAKLIDHIRKRNGGPFDISGVLGATVCNVICHIAIGQEYDFEDQKFQAFVKDIYNLYGDEKMSETLAVMIVYPIVEHINPFKAAADDYRAKVNRLTGFANNALKKHSNSIDENAISDYLTAFLHEQKSRNGGDGFTDPQLMRALLDFFVAGTETISTSTLWALLFLIHYPEIQKKLYDEINFISDNKESDIEWNDHTNCPYTNAFIQEVFRCRPVTPLGLQRMTAKDVELEGYFIPKGTPVMGNIWSVHHDPKHWKNPEAFQPERHLNEEGDFIFSKKIIPFCIGTRVCPGEKLARMEMFFLVTNLVKKFEFSSDPSSPKLPEMTDGVKGFLYTPHHYKIVAKARI